MAAYRMISTQATVCNCCTIVMVAGNAFACTTRGIARDMETWERNDGKKTSDRAVRY